MTPIVLSLFNHKGGVSKTTTCFNLGWALADKGHKVLLVDADPQCNLTGMALSLSGNDDLSEFYEKNPNANLYNCLQPAFGGAPEKLSPAAVVPTLNKNLFLIAGHIDISLYEPELSMAQKLVDAMPVFQNLPGSFGYLIRTTAAHIKADYVIIDMSPSVGALNQNMLIQSDYFIIPTSPDFFCYMAIQSLIRVLPMWNETAENLRRLNKKLTYKIPEHPPKFIGMISQRFRPRSGKPASAFQRWIDLIKKRVNQELVPTLQKYGMSIQKSEFDAAVGSKTGFELSQIADFNSLIAQSQEHGVPIFALTESQLNRQGVVLEAMMESSEGFKKTFSKLADDVIELTKL